MGIYIMPRGNLKTKRYNRFDKMDKSKHEILEAIIYTLKRRIELLNKNIEKLDDIYQIDQLYHKKDNKLIKEHNFLQDDIELLLDTLKVYKNSFQLRIKRLEEEEEEEEGEKREIEKFNRYIKIADEFIYLFNNLHPLRRYDSPDHVTKNQYVENINAIVINSNNLIELKDKIVEHIDVILELIQDDLFVSNKVKTEILRLSRRRQTMGMKQLEDHYMEIINLAGKKNQSKKFNNFKNSKKI